VDFTAAAEGNFFLRSVDASSATFSEGELTAVVTPLSLAFVQFLAAGDLPAVRNGDRLDTSGDANAAPLASRKTPSACHTSDLAIFSFARRSGSRQIHRRAPAG
jgi:hypothetical protein